MLRAIDRFVDLSDLRRHLGPFYSSMGRPSIDPELMIHMLLVGYCLGIRSEWRLCEEVHLNLAYRWFCRLGLEDKVPDHSTFCKNRHGRSSGMFLKPSSACASKKVWLMVGPLNFADSRSGVTG
jgi:transposase